MQNKLLHTPEGVRDIYGSECQRKHTMLQIMKETIASYGYESIETPTFEFFDIFGKEVGTTPSRDLYKFFDREGNTLVLRPDITPSIARAASKYFPIEEKPVRLCYEGNVFINNNSYQGRLKESTQLGAELIGEDSIDADAEMLALVVKTLLSVGLSEFQISIGHATIFQSLMKEAKFSEDETEELKNLIVNKNFFGVEEFLHHYDLSDEFVRVFDLLGKMYNCPNDWNDILPYAEHFPAVSDALCYMTELYRVLELYGVADYVSFEMGLISGYDYYTGVLFRGYTYGTGEPIVQGGRYNGLLSYFGKQAPAIGFALMADALLLALERQQILLPIEEQKDVILYTKECRESAIALAEELRADKTVVLLVCVDFEKRDRASYEKEYVGYRITVFDGE